MAFLIGFGLPTNTGGRTPVPLGGTMDVADWLHKLGLGQYEAAFRENSVTVDLLPTLTLEDLKDLGVTLVGHRRRLLDAIAAFAGANPLSDVPAYPSKSAP